MRPAAPSFRYSSGQFYRVVVTAEAAIVAVTSAFVNDGPGVATFKRLKTAEENGAREALKLLSEFE